MKRTIYTGMAAGVLLSILFAFSMPGRAAEVVSLEKSLQTAKSLDQLKSAQQAEAQLQNGAMLPQRPGEKKSSDSVMDNAKQKTSEILNGKQMASDQQDSPPPARNVVYRVAGEKQGTVYGAEIPQRVFKNIK